MVVEDLLHRRKGGIGSGGCNLFVPLIGLLKGLVELDRVGVVLDDLTVDAVDDAGKVVQHEADATVVMTNVVSVDLRPAVGPGHDLGVLGDEREVEFIPALALRVDRDGVVLGGEFVVIERVVVLEEHHQFSGRDLSVLEEHEHALGREYAGQIVGVFFK